MTEATYTAWDGKLYEWPPPQGWYEASDGRWWPEGYGPQPESEIETSAERGSVATGAVEADRTESGAAEVMTDDEVSAGSTSYPSSTGLDTRSLTADAGESAAHAAAAITGDHKPMTAWVAESADTPVADIVAGRPVESVSTSEAGPGEWAGRWTDAGLEESVESRDRDEDGEPGDSQLGTSGAAAGLTDLAGETRETGGELFSRLQAEAREGGVTEQVAAEFASTSDAAAEVVSGIAPDAASAPVPDVVPDAVSDVVPDAASAVDAVSDVVPDAVSAADAFGLDSEPTTTEQPVIDATSRSEFSGRFGSSRPGFANSAYDEPSPDEPAPDEPAPDEQAYDQVGYEQVSTADPAAAGGSISDEAAQVDEGHDLQAFGAPGVVDTRSEDGRSDDAQSFTPGLALPLYDAPGYDPEASTDPGFVGDRRGGDHRAASEQAAPEQPVPGQPTAQASSLDYESTRAAVSPMDAPTPSVGLGRRIFYAILGVLALVAAGVAGYLAFQLQNDSDDSSTGNTGQGAAQADGEAAIGSLSNPHDPGTAIRIEYPDGAEAQTWTLQLQSVQSDGTDGEARVTMQIVNDEVEGQGQLSDLRLALVDADGNDLASTPSPCRAGDSLDLTATVEAGQLVSGPVCWSVDGALPDNALLAVESTKAQGRVYISMP